MRPSSRPALKASEIPPQNLNLRDGERQSIVCPDCDTWHPLYRKMIKTHHLDREVRGGRAPRCPGSAQLIDMNITVEQWGLALLDAESVAVGRRSARQFYKPLAEAPVPVSCMARAPKSESDRFFQDELNTARQRAREAVVLHRSSCTACQSGRFCGTGRQLEERETWTEEAREEQRTKQACVQKADRSGERARDVEHALRRRHQWREADPHFTKYTDAHKALADHKRQCRTCKPKHRCPAAEPLHQELTALKQAYGNRQFLQDAR